MDSDGPTMDSETIARSEEALQKLYGAVARVMQSGALEDLPCVHVSWQTVDGKDVSYPVEPLQQAVLAILAPRYLGGFEYEIVSTLGGDSFAVVTGVDSELFPNGRGEYTLRPHRIPKTEKQS